jgi:hypothetical protein
MIPSLGTKHLALTSTKCFECILPYFLLPFTCLLIASDLAAMLKCFVVTVPAYPVNRQGSLMNLTVCYCCYHVDDSVYPLLYVLDALHMHPR